MGTYRLHKRKVRSIRLLLAGFLLVLSSLMIAQAPRVDNVRFEQRADGSLLVDIYYDVSSGGGLLLDISVEASDDDGVLWDLPCKSLSGDIGEGITAGQGKHIVWDFYADNPGILGDAFRIRVNADQNVIGQTITGDFILMEDLQMHSESGYGIRIGASGITLDLGGHTITGNIKNAHQEGILGENVDSITIKNGTMDGFVGGVVINSSGNVTIENMHVQNLEVDDPDLFLVGMTIGESHDILVRNCSFNFLPVAHKEAVIMGSTYDFVVDSIEVHGGSVGVNFGGSAVPSNGSVTNSTFVDGFMPAILLHYSTDALISNNIFLRCNDALNTDPAFSGQIKGIKMLDNVISGGNIGVMFQGIIESTIENNIIRDCRDVGIGLKYNVYCPLEGPYDECFISTANVIRGNEVETYGIDLYHHESSLGNTWEDNTCKSKFGIEIPECSPTISSLATAGTHLDSMIAMAGEVASDAQLLMAYSWACDTLGMSGTWTYIYESESQQTMFECLFYHGKILQDNTLNAPWMLGEDPMPIPGPWIDTDSAIAIAEELGGREFRSNFDLMNIEMTIASHYQWVVNYVALDTMFRVCVDASRE